MVGGVGGLGFLAGHAKGLVEGSEEGGGVEVAADGVPCVLEGAPLIGKLRCDGVVPILAGPAGGLEEGIDVIFEFGEGAAGGLEGVEGKVKLLAVVAAEEGGPNFGGVKAFIDQIGKEEEIALAFSHFATFDEEVDGMDPMAGERLSGGGFALGDFIFVVGEAEILAPAVEVEVGTEVLEAHGGALEVPSWSAGPPRTLP